MTERRVSPLDPSLPVGPLTPLEIAEFRSMLQQSARVKWFWGSVRVWAAWIGACGAAAIWFRDTLKTLLKTFLGL